MKYEKRDNIKILRKPFGFFRLIILVCVALTLTSLSISNISNANEDYQTAEIDIGVEYRAVKIGVLAKRGVEQCQEKWQPTAEYLTNKIPGYSFEIEPLKFDELNQAVEKGEVDFILANPSFYVELEYRYGSSRIATLKTPCRWSVYSLWWSDFLQSRLQGFKASGRYQGQDLHGS